MKAWHQMMKRHAWVESGYLLATVMIVPAILGFISGALLS